MHERDLPRVVEMGLTHEKWRLFRFLESVPVRRLKEKWKLDNGKYLIDERFAAQIMIPRLGPMPVAVRRTRIAGYPDSFDFVVGNYRRAVDRSQQARKLFEKLEEAERLRQERNEDELVADMGKRIKDVSPEQVSLSKNGKNDDGVWETQFSMRLDDDSSVWLGKLSTSAGYTIYLETGVDEIVRVEEKHPHSAFGVQSEVLYLFYFAQQKYTDRDDYVGQE